MFLFSISEFSEQIHHWVDCNCGNYMHYNSISNVGFLHLQIKKPVIGFNKWC